MICSKCEEPIIACDGDTFNFDFDTGIAICSGCWEEPMEDEKIIQDGDDLTWKSIGELAPEMPSFALIYDDKPLTLWDRIKIAWHYIRTGDFVDPRMIAHVEFPDED